MPVEPKKLLIIEAAALGWELSQKRQAPPGILFRKAETVFPALTCPVQASFRTGLTPSGHGVVANGWFFRDLGRVLFWEQSARLAQGTRFWQAPSENKRKAGMLFWQQSLGEDVEVLLSPRPIHKHHGGMIQDCYSQPEPLYQRLATELGRPFNLMSYWGPLASVKSSEWIAAATEWIMREPSLAPDLLLTYLPHLDYDLQRRGPASPAAFQALEKLYAILSNLWKTALETGYEVLVFGDYAIEGVTRGAVFPNRLLRAQKLFQTRQVRGMAYPDFFASRAFAVADHQIAHVYVPDPADRPRVMELMKGLDGVGEVLDADGKRQRGLDHPRAGDLVLVATKGAWFAYPWWTGKGEAPDYASHVDIHNKPGYDPCELFFGWPPPGISSNPDRIKGTHGRGGDDCAIAWAASFEFAEQPRSLLDLSAAVANKLRSGTP